MSDDVAVVWLAPASPRDENALVSWARAHGLRLVSPAEPAPEPRIDLAVGDDVEKELDAAREAIAAADSEAAERALGRAERLLREHPELPHAAWLRAEVERAWSTRWTRTEPRNEERARAAWSHAVALDGGRAFGVAEKAYPAPPRFTTTLVVRGVSSELYLDGLPIAGHDGSYEVTVAAGEHHLLVRANGRTTFAAWVAITEGATLVTTNDAGACVRDAFASVRRNDGSIASAGVHCPAWVAASPSDRADRAGSVLVARCENDHCGPLAEWRTEPLAGAAPPPAAPKRSGWPAWATWTLIGVGTATAASVALVAAGAFDDRPVERRFVVGGAKQE